ncbi:MAG: hypothetical protein M0Z98_07500 [Actinomycetales bacterium]|nr:hypothetical protein [Actinomycetales bacterium]
MSEQVHERTDALLRRVAGAVGTDGRLPLPDVTTWDIFPFEGELRVKRLEQPVLPEPPRHGEGGLECGSCRAGLADAIWADDRWKLVAPGPSAIPMVLLCPIAHLDLADLDGTMARDLGFLAWRVDAALTALGGTGRVHMNKWGDGGAHLHVWFFARPEGMLQLRGSSLSDWADCLPPMEPSEWTATMRRVAEEMATLGGRALV